jgi:hypothetical protein
MKTKITVKAATLKNFLGLFSPETTIKIIEFGDTWHPAGGYVDEKILGNPKTVQDLISFDYDFKGLVVFAATIGEFSVDYHLENFQIEANQKQIEQLLRKIMDFNIDPQSKLRFEVMDF